MMYAVANYLVTFIDFISQVCQPPARLGCSCSSCGIKHQPELIGHDAVLAAVGRAAHTVGVVVGQAEVVSHLVRDGGGEANGAVMVILRQTHTGDVTPRDRQSADEV